MEFNLLNNKKEKQINRKWKEENKQYLKQLQKFLDTAENINKEELKKTVIIEMLKCDKILTEIAEKEMIEQNRKMYKN